MSQALLVTSNLLTAAEAYSKLSLQPGSANEYVVPGGFWPFVVDFNGTIVAHGFNPVHPTTRLQLLPIQLSSTIQPLTPPTISASLR